MNYLAILLEVEASRKDLGESIAQNRCLCIETAELSLPLARCSIIHNTCKGLRSIIRLRWPKQTLGYMIK